MLCPTLLSSPEPGSGEDTYIGHPVSPKPTACSQRDFVRAWDCTKLPPFQKITILLLLQWKLQGMEVGKF